MGIGLIMERGNGIQIQMMGKENITEIKVMRPITGDKSDIGKSDRKMRHCRRERIMWRESVAVEDLAWGVGSI